MSKASPETKQKKKAPKKPPPFIIIDNRNMFGWLLSCFFVCGCIFFIGVLVGRNTAPVQFDVDRIEEKLSRLQESVLKQKEKEPGSHAPCGSTPLMAAPDSVELAELPIVHENIIDTLKDKGVEPEIYKQYIPPILTPKYPKTPPADQKALADETPSKAEAQPPERTLASTAPPKPVAVLKPEVFADSAKASEPLVTPEEPASGSPAASADQGFAIQVASLKDPEKARMLMHKFKEKGYPAFCQSSKVDGTTWHRVRIGPYSERTTAVNDQKRLKAAGVDSLVITMN